MPALLRLRDVTGAVGTMDALGCQKALAKTMTEQGAEYVLALKDHHPTLSAAVTLLRNDARATGCADIAHAYHETVDGDHGRMATCRYWSTSAMAWLGAKASWSNVHRVGADYYRGAPHTALSHVAASWA